MAPKRLIFNLDSSGSEDESDNSKRLRPQRTKYKYKPKPKQLESAANKSDSEDYMVMDLKDDRYGNGERETIVTEAVALPAEAKVVKSMPKGFAMMQKMGFTMGDGLGLNSNNALKVPITVSRRAGRQGIKESSHPDILVESHTDTNHFRAWIQQSNKYKEKEKVFNRMQKLAFEMSGDVDTFTSERDPRDFNCLWRRYIIDLQTKCQSRTKEHRGEFSGQGNINVRDSIPDVHTGVKRATIIENDDEAELPIKSETKNEDVQKSGLSTYHDDEELSIFEELEIDQKILGIHTFMRAEFFYCFYCGVKYKNEDDMFQHCPGQSKEDHV